MSKEITQAIAEASIRVSAIFPLHGEYGDWPEALEQFASDDRDEIPKELLILIPEDERDDFDWDCLRDYACDAGMFGFITIAQCPVFKPTGDGAVTFSWGHYRTRVFYSQTCEQGIQYAVDWGNGEFAKASGKKVDAQ